MLNRKKILWHQLFESIFSLESNTSPYVSNLWNNVLESFYIQSEKALSKALLVEYYGQRKNNITHDDLLKQISDKRFGIVFKKNYSELVTKLESSFQRQKDDFFYVLDKLNKDRLEIETSFQIPSTAKVLSVKWGVSDFHNGNKAVHIFSFSSLQKLIYKPRPSTAEIAFYEFVKVINNDISHPHYIPNFLDKSQYHWMEFIEHAYCTNEIETKSYHYRIGSLIAISFGLCATDFHYENLISKGVYPVIIDLDSLLLPRLKEKVKTEYTVMQSGLLPSRLWDPKSKKHIDVSGVSSDVYVEYTEETLSDLEAGPWHIQKTILQVTRYKNCPVEDNYKASRFVSEILNGFRDTYKAFLEKKCSFSEFEKSSLNIFKEIPMRFIPRNTNEYEVLRMGQFHPILISNNEIRDEYFSILDKTPGVFEDNTTLLEHEKAAISQMDIPYFWTTASSLDLHYLTSEGVRHCPNFFSKSGFDSLLSRWNEKISKNDFKRQAWFIEMSLTLSSETILNYNYNPYDLDQCIDTLISLSGLTIKDETYWVDYNTNSLMLETISPQENQKWSHALLFVLDHLESVSSRLEISKIKKSLLKKTSLDLKRVDLCFRPDQESENKNLENGILNMNSLIDIDKKICSLKQDPMALNKLFNNQFVVNFGTPNNIALPRFNDGIIGLAYITTRLHGAPSIFNFKP